MLKQFIEVQTQFEATHCWPDCPFEEVNFLRFPHRHLIFVNVRLQTNEDRQVEFFRFKMLIDNLIEEMYGGERIKFLGSKSMESIAFELLEKLSTGKSSLSVSVSEDNQVRSIVEYEPFL